VVKRYVVPRPRNTKPYRLNGIRSTFAPGSPSIGRVRSGGLFRANRSTKRKGKKRKTPSIYTEHLKTENVSSCAGAGNPGDRNPRPWPEPQQVLHEPPPLRRNIEREKVRKNLGTSTFFGSCEPPMQLSFAGEKSPPLVVATAQFCKAGSFLARDPRGRLRVSWLRP
jgi:hypothetical protein